MLSVSVGPLGLPVDRLLLIVAGLVALLAGWLAGRRRGIAGQGIGAVLPDMLLVGLLAARLAFVARWFEHYRTEPWTMLDIRDGGFDPVAGLVVALLFGAWRGWRRPGLRRPLVLAVTAGALAWGGLAIGLQQIRSATPVLPGIALRTLAGNELALADLAQGRPLVVNLWATWCPPCVREMPVLATAQQREPEIAFVFVNQSEGADQVASFMARRGLALDNMLLDAGGGLARAVGSRSLPTTLFYDAQGRLVDSHLGALSEASLAARLARLRPGR